MLNALDGTWSDLTACRFGEFPEHLLALFNANTRGIMRVEYEFIFASFSRCSEAGQSPSIDAKNGYNTKADDLIPPRVHSRVYGGPR